MSNFKSFLAKLHKKLPILLIDITAIPIAWYAAYFLRYQFHHFEMRHSFMALMVVFGVQVICYYHFKIYRGVWRFSSINDLIRIIQAVFVSTLVVIPVLYQTALLQEIPRTIIPFYALILLALLCGARLTRRLYSEGRMTPSRLMEAKRVLIVGAGLAGESLVRELKKTNNFWPIGFVDDDPVARGMEIHGVPVLGAVCELAKKVVKHRIDLVFIAIPTAGSAEMRRIVEYCEESRVPFRTLPTFSELASGKVELKALREVSLEDLLGRDLVRLEWDKIKQAIQGQRVLVTGGGGSIGAELCRQIMTLNPVELLIIDHSEYNLYEIERELRAQFPQIVLRVELLSVTDYLGINVCFSAFKPQIVFHAAAYKHVPMLEGKARVAVMNNVMGTQIIAEASAHVGAEKFVLISSDKAVNPTNIMGATKRVAEIFCQNFNEQVQTQFITVRFGNVLGSAGSVVPLFKQQIAAGGPVTVTHPDIKRYFMTIPEACQLILQAMANGQGSEIFVLDMGEPIKISYLAEQMIRLSGHVPGEDIDIVYTGLRPGEKLFEELFHESEQLVATEHEKLLKARFRSFDWHELLATFRLLNGACTKNEEAELYILLKSLVPEFRSAEVEQVAAEEIVNG